MAVSVLVGDDREVVRLGLIALLTRDPDVEVVADAASVADLVRLARRHAPDVTIVAADLAGTREVREAAPGTAVLVLSDRPDDDVLFASIAAGASGFLLTKAPAGELLDAVRHLAAGRSLLDTEVTATVLERLRAARHVPADERLARLSSRELEILTLVAEGRSNLEIAEALFLSEKTVKNHLTHVMTKLGVARRTEAAAYFNRQAVRYQL